MNVTIVKPPACRLVDYRIHAAERGESELPVAPKTMTFLSSNDISFQSQYSLNSPTAEFHGDRKYVSYSSS